MAVRGLLGMFRRLGPVRASNLGGRLGRVIGPLLPVSKVADANLRLALPELDQPARRRIVRGVWENLGRTAAEFPHLRTLRKDTPSGPGWEAVGAEVLESQARAGGPVLFVSGHIGNWEMLPPTAAHFAPPLLLVPSRRRQLPGGRRDPRRAGCGDGRAGTAVRQGRAGGAAHVVRGGSLGMLVDQQMNDGIQARLFGHPAMTAAALAAIALRQRCQVIPGRIERLGPARLRLVVEAPLALPDSGDRMADQAALTQQINDMLERWIRDRPESWLWLHRRWPRDLTRNLR